MTPESFKEIVKRHFTPSREMFEKQIEFICNSSNRGDYLFELTHVVESMDYWMNRKINGEDTDSITQKILLFLEDETKHEIDFSIFEQYWEDVKNRIERFIDKPPFEENEKWTSFDTLIVQIRHIQYHVGSINRKLSEDNNSPVKWIGYGE